MDPLPSAGSSSWTCPRCGAPLPVRAYDRTVTCDYCGVRTEVSRLLPRPPAPFSVGETGPPPESPPEESPDDVRMGGPSYRVRAVIAIAVVVAVLIAVIGGLLLPSSTPGPSVTPCSVTINASSDSGPAPFTATFTANVTAPPGVTTTEPEWQFGPFGPGLDFNFTYGSTVTHTWDTSGSFGVHVTVPDSTLTGCWATMSVNVT